MSIENLVEEQSEWSQRTFGSDAVRGPIGVLRHLAKEVEEALSAPSDVEEYADCFLLIIDAARRAGFTWPKLLQAAMSKMTKNAARSWPKPVDDMPVEHIKG